VTEPDAASRSQLLLPRAEPRGHYLGPSVALSAAGVLLAISLFLPYWELVLVTPARADALRLVSYLGHVDGPVETILATAGVHGPAPLLSLSRLERSLALATGAVICLLVIGATLVRNRWAALLALPALCFPLIVLADTARWLEPILTGLVAASSTPAVPVPLFGRLALDRMVLEIRPGSGLVLATLAAIAVLAGLWLHRDAYKSRAADR
jgi:hypothetical protein